MKNRNTKGFTLIELIIIIAIIGVLAAIAIPQFSNYRSRAFDTAAIADLRNAMTAQEAYYVDWEKYTDSELVLIGSYNLYITDGVEFSIAVFVDNFYRMETYHPSGTGLVYRIDGPGGSIEAVEP